MSESKSQEISVEEEQAKGLKEASSSVGRLKDLTIDQLLSRDLLVALKAEKIRSPVQTIAKFTQNNKNISLIVFDGKKITLRELQGAFEYLDEETIYEDLKTDEESYYRPLLNCSVSHINESLLELNMIEASPILRGKGVVPMFLGNLREMVRQLGYKFMGAHHNSLSIARPFLEQGAFLLEELKPEYREAFKDISEGNPDTVPHSLHFLHNEDKEKYIQPDRLFTSVEDKIEYKEKLLTLHEIFEGIEKTIKHEHRTEVDVFTSAEVLEELFQHLTTDDKPGLDFQPDDPKEILLNIALALTYMKGKVEQLAKGYSLKTLEDNLATLKESALTNS